MTGANERRGSFLKINLPHAKLQPALGIRRQVDFPNPPGVKVLFAQLLIRHLVPHATAVAADLDALGPVAAAGISPAAHVDGTVVNDDGLVDGRHDGARDGHLADTKASAISAVMLADLRREIEVLLLLHRCERW